MPDPSAGTPCTPESWLTKPHLPASSGKDGECAHRSDGLHLRSLGPRELEALALIEQRPGMTVAELADAMGVSMQRVWQIVGRLELGRVRRDPARSWASDRGRSPRN